MTRMIGNKARALSLQRLYGSANNRQQDFEQSFFLWVGNGVGYQPGAWCYLESPTLDYWQAVIIPEI